MLRLDLPLKLLLATLLVVTTSILITQASKGAVKDPQAVAGPPIYLQSRTLTPSPGVAPTLAQQVSPPLREHVHVLIQLEHLPSPSERQALISQGILLQHYVPQQAWIARIKADAVMTVAANPAVRWIGPWQKEDKIAPALRRGPTAPWIQNGTERLQVTVVAHADVSLTRAAGLIRDHQGLVVNRLVGPHALTAWLKPQDLLGLAAEEEILWIDEGAMPLEPTNDGTRANLGVETLQEAPYGLSGKDVRVLVFDAGNVDSHDDFDERLTAIDTSGVDAHATHVAGTVGASGLRSSDDGGAPQQWRGMAPQVQVLSAGYQQYGGTELFWDNAGDIESDYAQAREDHGADLATNSIGSNTASNGYPCEREGDYGISSQLIDDIVRGDNSAVGSPYIVTWANGNERTGSGGRCGSTYHTTAPPSCAKNPIHVGAINSDFDSMTSFSSWGPCDDGRLKPTLVAPGCETGLLAGSDGFIKSTAKGPWPPYYAASYYCGTSMATPAVAGVISLLLEQYRELAQDPEARPSNALVKAWLIHTARDRGSDGPDYMFGYGGVDAVAATELVQAGTGAKSALTISTPRYLTATLSAPDQVEVYTFTLPADVKELRASLVWDDVSAASFVSDTHTLVNDLDLSVLAPDDTVYWPWVLDPANPHLPATTGVNRVDNQEQVIVANPGPGDWRVVVSGTRLPQAPQDYALVVTHRLSRSQTCSSALTDGGFESGAGWSLGDGTVRTTAYTYEGDYSLRLGGENGALHAAYQPLSIPTPVIQANLSYRWAMTTTENTGSGYDHFYAQIRDNSGENVLAVYEMRSERYPQDLWLVADNLDLTPFAGQSVRLYFYATTNGSDVTSFYVDDVALEICRPPLEAAKTSAPDPAIAGEPLTYTLTLTNCGDHDLTALTVSDPLPSQVSYAAADAGGIYSATTHTVQWSDLNLPVSQSLDLTLWVTPNAMLPDGTFLSNSFVARANGENLASAKAQTVVANVRLIKSAQPDPAYAGSSLTYTLYVENPRSSPTDLVLSDALPEGLLFSSFVEDDDGRAHHEAGRVLWNDRLDGGITDVVRFVGYVSPTISKSLHNVAVLTTAQGITVAAASEVKVINLQLELTKTVYPTVAHVGDPLTYTVQLFNHEPTSQTVVVRDALPAEVAFGGFLENAGGKATYSSATRTLKWQGELAPAGHRYTARRVTRSFVDIRQVGTAVSDWIGSTDDEAHAEIPLPWPFSYYGTTFTTLRIGSNGNVGFSPFTFGGFWDTGFIPHPNLPNNRISLYYYDQDGGEGSHGGGTIFTYHDVSQDRFIVQYDDWKEWSGDGVSTYEAILYSDGRIELIFDQVYKEAALRGPTGLENADGSAGLVVAQQPSDGDAFLITPLADASRFVYTTTIVALPPEGIVNTVTLTDQHNLSRVASAVTQVGYRTFLPLLVRTSP